MKIGDIITVVLYGEHPGRDTAPAMVTLIRTLDAERATVNVSAFPDQQVMRTMTNVTVTPFKPETLAPNTGWAYPTPPAQDDEIPESSTVSLGKWTLLSQPATAVPAK